MFADLNRVGCSAGFTLAAARRTDWRGLGGARAWRLWQSPWRGLREIWHSGGIRARENVQWRAAQWDGRGCHSSGGDRNYRRHSGDKRIKIPKGKWSLQIGSDRTRLMACLPTQGFNPQETNVRYHHVGEHRVPGGRLVTKARADFFPEAHAVKCDEGNLWVEWFYLQPKPKGASHGRERGRELEGQLETGPGKSGDDKLWMHTDLGANPAFTPFQPCAPWPCQ